MKRRIRNAFFLLIGSVVLGILLLLIVFALPVDSVRQNVEKSLPTMVDVEMNPVEDLQRKEFLQLKESFTDCLMVQNAMERVAGKNIIEHAMYIYHYDLSNDATWLTEESLVIALKEGTEGLYLREYSRYWHGYLIWLKPLLMFMSWETVESFLLVVQIAFLLVVIALGFYKKQGLLGLGLVAALIFMKPMRIWVSHAMSVSWGVTTIAMFVLFLWYHKLEQKKWQEEFFLMIGIFTAYMDFLTYPIVTLGVPLCAYLVMNQEVQMKWFQRIVKLFWMGVLWVVGYIGMWGMKWVCAEIFCQSGTLRNAVWSVIFRTTPLDGYGSAFTGVSRTLTAVFNQYDSIWYVVALVVILIGTLLSGVWCFIKAGNTDWIVTMVCLAVLALLPFAWLILTQNHTAIHCIFTFRIMGVTIFALWCMMVCSIQTVRKLKNKGKE